MFPPQTLLETLLPSGFQPAIFPVLDSAFALKFAFPFQIFGAT